MRRTTRAVASLTLIAGVMLLAAGPASGSWWDSLSTPKQVTLAKVLADPYAHKAVPIEFTIQFHETTEFYNPFFTRFTPERYVGFAAWGDEAALWMPEDFAASHPLFFVDKNTDMAKTILKISPFTRLKVTALVSSTFKGEAWIEVLKLTVERKSLSRGALGDIISGDKYAQADRHNAAIQHYLKAYNAKGLPPTARAFVAARLGRSYLYAEKPAEAEEYLNKAVKMNPKDEESKRLMDRALGKIAGAPDEAPDPRLGPGEQPAPEAEGETFETPEAKPAPENEPAPVEPAPDKVEPDKENPEKRLSPPR